MTSPRPQRFDLIVFDWDGTLFDSTALIVRCIQAACADVGVRVPSEAEAAYVIGLGLEEALAHAAPELPRARLPEIADRYRHHYFARQHELTLFDGTLADARRAQVAPSLAGGGDRQVAARARCRARHGSASCAASSTPPAPPTKPPASPTRACSTS